MHPQLLRLLSGLAVLSLPNVTKAAPCSDLLMSNETCETESIYLPPSQKNINARQCPECIAKLGRAGCDCETDWSSSTLECIADPQPSSLTGYSSRPIRGDDGLIAIKGTYILTNTFRVGYACHDGVGGYYSGAFCQAAHGSICPCKDGEVWTNAGTCLPLVCDPIRTPDRCTCTKDGTC